MRHGDALSHLIFDLAADALAILLENAKRIGLVKELLGEYIDKGVNMLQYEDDTIFLMQDDFDSAHNLKLIMCLFEQMSGLKINFHKCGLFLFGDSRSE